MNGYAGHERRLEALAAGLTERESALVAAASSLVPILSANAEDADQGRRLPEADITALREAGIFRLGAPRAFGGHAVSTRAALAITAELGRGCSSASWVVSVFYGASLLAGLFPDQVRQRIWGENPDATVSAARGVPVHAKTVDGGYSLTGRWGWASGVHHASWVGLDVLTEPGAPAQDRGFALVPASELSLEDTWHMTGMRGTGSDTVVAEGVFVPRDQVISVSKAVAGGYWRAGDDEARTRVTMPQGTMLLLSGAVLGMGMAMYDHAVDKVTGGRPLVSGAKLHSRAIDAPGVQANVADAAMLIDSAVLQVARSARSIDEAARNGTRLSPLAGAGIRMDGGFAARQVRRAVDKLLDAGGASRFAESSPAQRIWRDLGTASRHPAFVVEIDREAYARLLLGLD